MCVAASVTAAHLLRIVYRTVKGPTRAKVSGIAMTGADRPGRWSWNCGPECFISNVSQRNCAQLLFKTSRATLETLHDLRDQLSEEETPGVSGLATSETDRSPQVVKTMCSIFSR